MRHYSNFGLVFAAMLTLAGCGAKGTKLSKSGTRGATNVNCSSPLQVTLQRTNTSSPRVNEDVVFRLEASGCSGEYKLSDSTAIFASNQPFFFTRRYANAGNVRESILVQDANFPTQSSTAVEEFAVSAPSGAITCQAAVSPSRVVLNAAGKAQVNLTVTHTNVPSSIIFGLRLISGPGFTLSPTTPVPSADSASAHSLSIEFDAIGQYVFAVDIRESTNATNTNTCLAIANVSNTGSVGFPSFPIFQFGAFNPALGPIDRPILVENSSGVPITILTLLIGSPDFSILGGTCASGLVLQPLASCRVDVRFLPVAGPAQRSATLSVHYAPPTGGALIAALPLQGSVLNLSAAVSLAPAGTIDFGTIAVGSAVNRPITVHNAGPASANLGAIVISSSVFEIVGSTCPTNQILPASTSCTLDVRFAPLTPATYSSSFVLNFTDAGGAASSASVTLSGTAEGSGATFAQGMYSTCAIRDGALKCWGRNDFGQVGDGTKTNRSRPVQVSGLDSGVQAVASGLFHTCALQNGGVKCWGYNGHGGLGDGTTDSRTAPVAVSGLGSGVTAIAAGGHSTCAIKNGDLYCWGYNLYGQVGDGTTSTRKVPVRVIDSGVTQVSMDNEWAAAATHTCAIQNGGVKCWGYNAFKSVGDRSSTNRTAPYSVSGLESGVSSVQAFMHRTCVIQNGAAKCWGHNPNGQLGDGTTTDRAVPTMVSGLDQGVTSLGGGAWHTCAVKTGRLLCWGYNPYGQLGDGTTTQRKSPVQVSGMESNVTEISKEDPHATCAKRQEKLYCWGYNGFGQLGDGSTGDRSAPGLVSGW